MSSLQSAAEKRPLPDELSAGSQAKRSRTNPTHKRFDGQGFYLTRLEGEEAGRGFGAEEGQQQDLTLSLPDLLEPRSRLSNLFIVAGAVHPSWMTTKGGLGNLPSSITTSPILIYNNNHDPLAQWGHEVTQVRGVLQRASFYMPEYKQWKVFKYDSRFTLLHAKLLLMRFASTEDDPGFLRVAIGSANLYEQWGHSRDVLWIQDFPISAPTPLPALSSDTHLLRQTLRHFTGALIRALALPPPMQRYMNESFVACIAGADTSESRGTPLASIPLASGLAIDWNGLRGLGTALATQAWPEAAAAADVPIPSLPNEGSRDADSMHAAETLTLLKGKRDQAPQAPPQPQPSSATQDRATVADAPAIDIVVNVQEEKTEQQAKRPRVEDGVHIKARADALSKASDHFRTRIRDGAESSTASIIRVEVSTWKELEALHRILRVAQEDGGDYCSKAGTRMVMDDLLPTILVARKFKFHDCIKQCAARIAQGTSEADAMALIMGL